MANRVLRLLVGVALLAGCQSTGSTNRTAGAPEPAETGVAVSVAGTMATGLAAPWGIAFLPDGSALVSERDTGRIVHVVDTVTTPVRVVDGVAPRGEGGLLGLARNGDWIYAYLTAAEDNRVIRMRWDGTTLGGRRWC